MSPNYDDYTIIQRNYGAGGSGHIHKAKDPDGRIVALKVPIIAFSEDTIDTSVIEAFGNEADTWQMLCRRGIPGIVEVFDHGVYNGIPWIAMEFMEGGDLRSRITSLTFDEKLGLMKKLLFTLSEVHRVGVIHRDIKPENILFTKEGVPKISDWGLGKVLLTVKTHTVNPKMSIHYAAPEQLTKKIPVDDRTDMYQFGAMCYELLTGRYLFPGDDLMESMNDILHEEPQALSELNADIPVSVERIILKCLRKKKEDRYRSIAVVLYELDHGVASSEGVASPPPIVKKKVKEPLPKPAVSDRCPECGNVIAVENKTLKCEGCGRFFCQTCEGWIEKKTEYRNTKVQVRFPLCEACYNNELSKETERIDGVVAEEEGRRKIEKERKKREAEDQKKRDDDTRKRQEDEKQRRALDELLHGMTTVENAAEKQQFWAQRLKADTEIVSPGGIRFMLLPAGTFTMGQGSDTHQVKLTKPFYLCKYQVTQKEWKKVKGDVSSTKPEQEDHSWLRKKMKGKVSSSHNMGSNPSYFKGDDLPVESVSWEECQEFIRKLNALEGTDKYRLPTEAEWEYACRAGSTTKYCFSDDENNLKEYAWYDNNSGSTTHPVGQKRPNVWGLHDMHGNVWEWCQDWYGDYSKGDVTDPQGPSSGSSRVVRGGSWSGDAEYCRSAPRFRDAPGDRRYSLGFRLLRSV